MYLYKPHNPCDNAPSSNRVVALSFITGLAATFLLAYKALCEAAKAQRNVFMVAREVDVYQKRVAQQISDITLPVGSLIQREAAQKYPAHGIFFPYDGIASLVFWYRLLDDCCDLRELYEVLGRPPTVRGEDGHLYFQINNGDKTPKETELLIVGECTPKFVYCRTYKNGMSKSVFSKHRRPAFPSICEGNGKDFVKPKCWKVCPDSCVPACSKYPTFDKSS